jgi:hypothetical protein
MNTIDNYNAHIVHMRENFSHINFYSIGDTPEVQGCFISLCKNFNKMETSKTAEDWFKQFLANRFVAIAYYAHHFKALSTDEAFTKMKTDILAKFVKFLIFQAKEKLENNTKKLNEELAGMALQLTENEFVNSED